MDCPPRASIECTNHILVFIGLVSWCSYVTTWSKPLSPTPWMSQGRGNEVTQGDGWASLALVAKTSSRCRWLFRLCGDYWKVAYVEHRRCMVRDHTWIRHGKHLACWLGFPLQGVHRFESPRLSDMSITCLQQSSRRKPNGLIWNCHALL
jgi:hypothetical protein